MLKHELCFVCIRGVMMHTLVLWERPGNSVRERATDVLAKTCGRITLSVPQETRGSVYLGHEFIIRL